jgi:hypothetical protein
MKQRAIAKNEKGFIRNNTLSTAVQTRWNKNIEQLDMLTARDAVCGQDSILNEKQTQPSERGS